MLNDEISRAGDHRERKKAILSAVLRAPSRQISSISRGADKGPHASPPGNDSGATYLARQ